MYPNISQRMVPVYYVEYNDEDCAVKAHERASQDD